MTFEEANAQIEKAGYLVWHLNQQTTGQWRARLGYRGRLPPEKQHLALRTGRDLFFTDTETGPTPAAAMLAALGSVARRDAFPVHESVVKALEWSLDHRSIISNGVARDV